MAKRKTPRKVAPTKAKAKKATAQKKTAGSSKPGEIKTVLHLGLSSAAEGRIHQAFSDEKEWKVIRMDPDPAAKADHLIQMHEMGTVIEKESLDAIWCPHVLHRYYPKEGREALYQAYKALKDGGLMLISMPDIQLAANYVANNKAMENIYSAPAGDVNAVDMLYGFRKTLDKGHHYLAHRYGYTMKMLAELLRETGFCHVQLRFEGTELVAVAYKYAYDNPNRVDRIAMVQRGDEDEHHKTPPKLQKTKVANPPGNRPRHNPALDRLEHNPVQWRPLGLKK